MPGSELIGKEELDEITDIFTTNKGCLYRYGTTNSKVEKFENEIKKRLKVRYALATSSGTAALIIAIRALGIKGGDEVITQSHTFMATVEAIVECGATPVIVDVDNTLNMNPNNLEEKITDRTKAIIPVHMSGIGCEMDNICRISYKYNIPILEDNAQSIGGTYKGTNLGTIGDIGILSFDFGKTITTGEGGMIITDNKRLYERCRSINDHGHAFNENLPRGKDEVRCLGFNFKMSELAGAVGLAQIRKLDYILKKQRKYKKELKESLSNTNLQLREISDSEGDTCDSLTFFYEKPNKFESEWTKKGYYTKNLPSAMKWHNAYYWNHICNSEFQKYIDEAVSIPITMNMNIKRIANDIKEIIK